MKTIVITGCSTGFGRVTAFHLAQQGWRVFATVRREADQANLLVEAMAKNLRETLIPVICDITHPADVARLARTVGEAAPQLDALLNNAGTGYPGPMETVPLADVRAQFEINTLGQLAVTQALLPLLKAARGMLLNVSSVGGRVTFPINGPYHMSKFALEAMSDVLRVELAPFGVRVVVLEPGSSPTGIWETSLGRSNAAVLAGHNGEYAPLLSQVEARARQGAEHGFPPELFARTVAKILDSRRPRTRYPVPPSVGQLMLARRLMPDWLWDWAQRRILKW